MRFRAFHRRPQRTGDRAGAPCARFDRRGTQVKPAVLEKLIEMADRNRDLAATRRARAEQARAAATGTLSSLELYRQNHRDNRRSAIGALPGASGLAVHARFGGKLDEAIDAQRDQCAALEQSLDVRSDELRKAHARLQALRA